MLALLGLGVHVPSAQNCLQLDLRGMKSSFRCPGSSRADSHNQAEDIRQCFKVGTGNLQSGPEPDEHRGALYIVLGRARARAGTGPAQGRGRAADEAPRQISCRSPLSRGVPTSCTSAN